MKYKLPVKYHDYSFKARREIREQYILMQKHQCYWCKQDLRNGPPKEITDKYINWRLFPEGFMRNPIHLQHDHNTGMTEGAVHAYCNAVMWQYHGR